MNITAKMVEITRKISAEGIGKTRKNTQQGYNFRGIDEVMQAFAPILSDAGVFLVPKFTDRTMVEYESKNGGKLFNVTVKGSFAFMAEDGSSVEVGPFFGEAMDSADKATNKAMAVAFKYAMFQTFCVPLEGVTGGDADATTHEVATTVGKLPKEARAPKSNARAAAIATQGYNEARSAELREIGRVMQSHYDDGTVIQGLAYVAGLDLRHDEKIAVWQLLSEPAKKAFTERREAA